jgi:pyruvate kinase
MRHTKIVATLGPASDSDDVLDQLMLAGVDVFRLNFSHGTHETHGATYARLRAAADRAGRIVAVLQDLSGPKIRTGRLAGGTPIALKRGDELCIVTGDFEGTPGRVSTSYAPLARVVQPGQDLLLDDGRIVLRVISSDGEEICTTVVHGTALGERKGINAPGVAMPATGLAPKDVEDVRFGLALGVDMVALSFVQTAADLQVARDVMNASGRTGVPLVAKIERPEALDHLDEVLNACEGVMVARGDLGLELPLERVPRVQKDVTRLARGRGLPVIVATQVLESMRTEPRPTRAEVSDAANAVDDGVDAIMLAGETAAGAFPARTVQTLDAIIRDAEAVPPLTVEVTGTSPMLAGHGRAICDAAVTLASRGDAHAIVAITRQGNTARVLSSLRPAAPILAATASPDVARRLSLHWGVQPFVVAMEGNLSTIAERVGAALLEGRLVPPGTTVVFVSVSDDLSQRYSNYLKLHRLT